MNALREHGEQRAAAKAAAPAPATAPAGSSKVGALVAAVRRIATTPISLPRRRMAA